MYRNMKTFIGKDLGRSRHVCFFRPCTYPRVYRRPTRRRSRPPRTPRPRKPGARRHSSRTLFHLSPVVGILEMSMGGLV